MLTLIYDCVTIIALIISLGIGFGLAVLFFCLICGITSYVWNKFV